MITRPENNSQFCYIHDPDHTMIELVFHERRPYPPVVRNEVPKKETAGSAAARTDSAGNGEGGATSADEARTELTATEGR